MSVHAIEVVADRGEMHLKLVCHAAPGAPCRMRPIDDRETWHHDDVGLVPGDCWAIDWQDAVGFVDGVMAEGDGVWSSIPVSVTYDECVVVRRVDEHTTLDLESHDSGEASRG